MESVSQHEDSTFDLVVIGAGPAGEKAAAQAAYFGKRVAVIEAADVGGAVVHTGTLPSKTLRETALYLSGLRNRSLYGIEYSFTRDVSVDDLFFREKLVERMHVDLVWENLDRHGVSLIIGTGELADAHTVLVHGEDGDTERVRGDYILVATGTHPARPAEIPFDDEYVYDSDTILRLKRIPSSMVIVGGGVIGSEYATVFGALGTSVSLIDGGARLLPSIDGELADILADQMRGMGVSLLFGRHVRSIVRGATSVAVTTDNDQVCEADVVLYCGGRIGNTQGLGLERLGIALDARGRILVDEHYATAVPSVLAAGDVIGFPALASTSMEQGRVAVCHAFGFAYKREVSSLVPYGLYTIPEISMVGATEESLRASGTPYLVGRGRFDRNARAQIAGDTDGLIKLIFDPESRRVLGIAIIGERASELIHVGQMCMQFGGTIDVFIDNVFNFPTIADAYKYAAYDGLQAIERARDDAASPA
jgi:NAD(P) transhydrogenase